MAENPQRVDGSQRLRGCSEQDIVDNGLVLERDDLNFRRHGEHDVEIRHVEQFRLPVLQPLRPRKTLALRAIAVATRVVRDALVAAIAATLDVTAERGSATILDRSHGMPLRGGQRRTVLITKSRAEATEHIRHFQPLAGHEPRLQAGTKSGTVGKMRLRDSSGLAVAQTVLVAIMRY